MLSIIKDLRKDLMIKNYSFYFGQLTEFSISQEDTVSLSKYAYPELTVDQGEEQYVQLARNDCIRQ